MQHCQNSQPYTPPTQLSIYSLHLPTSRYMKPVLLKLLCVCITFTALWTHENSTGPTPSAICPSYTYFHLFPVSTCLQMQETCSFELVLCSCNIPIPMDTQNLNSTHTLCHMPLLHPFLLIPCINLPPNETYSFELVLCLGSMKQWHQHCQPYPSPTTIAVTFIYE